MTDNSEEQEIVTLRFIIEDNDKEDFDVDIPETDYVKLLAIAEKENISIEQVISDALKSWTFASKDS